MQYETLLGLSNPGIRNSQEIPRKSKPRNPGKIQRYFYLMEWLSSWVSYMYSIMCILIVAPLY